MGVLPPFVVAVEVAGHYDVSVVGYYIVRKKEGELYAYRDY